MVTVQKEVNTMSKKNEVIEAAKEFQEAEKGGGRQLQAIRSSATSIPE
jgi:hypothetical protein